MFISIITKLLQGIFIGVSLILPGMSGGTALIILGFYRSFLKDISELKIKRYLVVAVGLAGGVLGSAMVITKLLTYYPNLIVSFLMGMLLASIKLVITPVNKTDLKYYYLFFSVIGFLIAWNFISEPLAQIPDTPNDSGFLFFGGGILTSATMLLPGVSGSSVLIILNLYDDLLRAVVNFEIWPKLILFTFGLTIGIIVFARLITSLYNMYRGQVSFFLAGLLLGSTKALIPSELNGGVALAILAGLLTVLSLTRNRQEE